jgi:hypothetical protein
MKNKNIKNPKRYGAGRHGKLPGFDFLKDMYDPGSYGHTEEDYKRRDVIEKLVEEMGLEEVMNRAITISNYGRDRILWDPRNYRDPLGYRNEIKTYRFKKNGEMYKVCKASMKSSAVGKLRALREQKANWEKYGRQLP